MVIQVEVSNMIEVQLTCDEQFQFPSKEQTDSVTDTHCSIRLGGPINVRSFLKSMRYIAEMSIEWA